MFKKAIIVALLLCMLAICFAGCGNSSTKSPSASASSITAQISESSSNASRSSGSTPAQSSETVFGAPDVVNVKSGSGSVIGTSANFYASKAECTKENLATWCIEYVNNSKDNWCVIVFSDDPDHGVYANNGLIEIGVGLTKDESDGSYEISSEDNTTVYMYDSKANDLIEIE